MRTSQLPVVSIGIPTYNGGEKIRSVVQSIMKQNYPNLDIIISDNCSDPETADIGRQLSSENCCVRYYRQEENIGMLSNFEFVLNCAKGKYFMWVADDDSLPADVLRRYVHFMEFHPSYSLVSGEIEYSLNGRITEYEKGFNFRQRSSIKRVIGFYFKVVHGAMFHGMMRTAQAKRIGIRKVIGSDWHFVATMAFIGKLRNLPFVGYKKKFGGSSRDAKKYAMMIGDTKFAGDYPFVKISLDAYREIASRSEIYSSAPFYIKYPLAIASMLAVLTSHYIKLYPFIIGGKLKRSVKSVSAIFNMPDYRQ